MASSSPPAGSEPAHYMHQVLLSYLQHAWTQLAPACAHELLALLASLVSATGTARLQISVNPVPVASTQDHEAHRAKHDLQEAVLIRTYRCGSTHAAQHTATRMVCTCPCAYERLACAGNAET